MAVPMWPAPAMTILSFICLPCGCICSLRWSSRGAHSPRWWLDSTAGRQTFDEWCHGRPGESTRCLCGHLQSRLGTTPFQSVGRSSAGVGTHPGRTACSYRMHGDVAGKAPRIHFTLQRLLPAGWRRSLEKALRMPLRGGRPRRIPHGRKKQDMTLLGYRKRVGDTHSCDSVRIHLVTVRPKTMRRSVVLCANPRSEMRTFNPYYGGYRLYVYPYVS